MQHSLANNQVRRKPRHIAHDRRRAARQTQKRTCGYAADGFLSTSFSPIIGRNLALLGNAAAMQKEYFNSLINLAALYNLQLQPFIAGYPQNIAQSFEAAKKQFESQNTGLELVIIKDKKIKACLSTIKHYDTGMCLYYIAVKPLAILLQNPYKQKQAILLLSVFAYLYQVAGMPDFHDGYVGSQYEYIYDSYTDGSADIDEDDYKAFMEWHKAMQFYGRKAFKSIRHSYHLLHFEERVKNFTPKTDKDTELLLVSTQILTLYLQNPSRRFFDNVTYNCVQTEEERRILPEEYVSFFWDAEGFMHDQLMEFVNIDFQEISCIEEPSAIQYFDTPQKAAKHDLSFEHAFFDCLHNLADLLDIL